MVPGKEAAPINLFDLFAKISLDTSEYDSGVKDVTKSGDSLASKLKSGLASAGKVAAAGIGTITAAAGAAVGGLLALESSTEEYRVAQGKLNTAFEAAGYGAETAQQAYNAFYGILGDTDTATEASQLLAKLADSAEDVSTWTDIAAGVAGTFGDALPIEGLIESANETARVGQVTGTLADALNWASISEDEFNAKLEACGSESERNQLIMDTLAGTYDEASEAFYRNNEALVEARNNQAQLDATLATLGQTVSNVKNQLLSEFLPAISNVATAFNDMVNGADKADTAFSKALGGLVSKAVNKLPEFLGFGTQILGAIASGLIQSAPVLVNGAIQAFQSLWTYISSNTSTFMTYGGQILSSVVSGITSALPQMATAAISLMSTFGTYLQENLPLLLQAGLEAVVSLTSSIRESAGLIVDGAIGLAQSLAQGLADSIPTIIENVPTIVTNIAGVINDNAPKIFAAAVNIIGTLIKGLIDAIPTLIENIPQIINAIVNTLLAFNWVNLGGSIIKGLGNGLKSMISFVKDIAGQIVSAIKGGISNLPQQMLTIGKNIVQGLWNGIKSMMTWITDKVSGFVGGIVSSVKGVLGIASPSKVFAGIGEYMAEGLAQGWDNEYDRIRRDIEGGMDFGTAQVDFASSGLGLASAGMVNGISAAVQSNGVSGGNFVFNLMMPDGTKFASYLLGPLVDYAKANGTPILSPS
nr:MAG TPA: minor tail protein [Caudoviricetes sp.]